MQFDKKQQFAGEILWLKCLKFVNHSFRFCDILYIETGRVKKIDAAEISADAPTVDL